MSAPSRTDFGDLCLCGLHKAAPCLPPDRRPLYPECAPVTGWAGQNIETLYPWAFTEDGATQRVDVLDAAGNPAGQ